MKTLLAFKIALLLSFSVMGNTTPSLRRCMILPVRDSVGGAMGYKVFLKIERYLKASKWCYYKPNSAIIDILGNYKKTLDAALENPQVLQLVAGKTNAGSLIRVRISSLAKGVEVKTQVVGANGKDIYFNESTELNTDEIDVIAQTVNNWLSVYEKNIPYDARIVGVLGNQITIDLGKDAGVYNGYEVQISRPVKRKVHPLLKEIVDWKTMTVGKARIFHVGISQSQAKIIEYDRETLAQPEDWVVITKTNTSTVQKEKLDYDPIDTTNDEFSFGKLGEIGIFGTIATGSNNISNTRTTKKMGGYGAGVEVNAEVWATRNYWLGMDIHKAFGSYSKKEGDLAKDSNSLSYTKFKLKAGYKYLPLGFFYGPQVDLYVGYGSYSYGFDNQVADKIVGTKFSGILLGARGSLPIVKDTRMYIMLDFLLKSSYEEDTVAFGQDESSSNFYIEFGGNYKYSPNMKFDGGISFVNSKAKFQNPETTLSLKNTFLKFGAKFNF